jgi:hypothetical protein
VHVVHDASEWNVAVWSASSGAARCEVDWGENHKGWEKYVEELEEKAENWRVDWELDEHLRENGLAHLISDGEADDEGAANLSDKFLGVY